MTEDRFLVPASDRPPWFVYPRAFRRVLEQRLIHLTPWHLLDAAQTIERLHGLQMRYPSRELFPFAYRQDNDDVACWARDRGERVFVIHDFASPGFEDEAEFDDFWSWFRAAVDETILWD